jgi:hypothetical protein
MPYFIRALEPRWTLLFICVWLSGLLLSPAPGGIPTHPSVDKLPGPAPDIDLVTPSCDFGYLEIRSFYWKSFTVRNIGTSNLQFIGPKVKISGTDADDFVLSTDLYTIMIVYPQDSITLRVQFYSDVPGEKSASLDLYTNDPDEPLVKVPITAISIPGQGEIEVTPDVVDFGSRSPGYPLSLPSACVIRNRTSDLLVFGTETVPAFEIIGRDASDFALIPGYDTSPMGAGSRALGIAFAPNVMGSREATLVITSSDFETSQVLVALRANTIPPAPDLSATNAFNVGVRLADGTPSFPLHLPLTNVGFQALQFKPPYLELSGPNANEFMVDPKSLPSGIGIEQSVQLPLRFAPTGVGSRWAILSIYSDDFATSPTLVTLYGQGWDLIPIKPYDGLGPGVSRVGPGGEYAMLSQLNAALAQTPLQRGDWTFLITGDVTDTGVLSVGAKTGDYGIYFRPAPGIAPVVDFTKVGVSYNVVIKGAKSDSPVRNIVFDGCSEDGGTTRSMTFRNSLNPQSGLLVSIANYSENIVFKNMNLECRNNATNSPYVYGSIVYQGLAYPKGNRKSAFATDCLVENCLVRNVHSPFAQGIIVTGYTAENGRVVDGIGGLSIRNCEIESSGRGLYVNHASDLVFEGNKVRVTQSNGGFNCYGILCTPLSTPPADDVHFQIRNNRIQVSTALTTNPTIELTGILIDGNGDRHRYELVNNMVSVSRQSPDGGVGRLSGVAFPRGGDYTAHVLHNSIHLVDGPASTPLLTAANCFGIGISNPGFTGSLLLRNNIIRNGQPHGGALNLASSTASYDSDYNCLFSISGVTGRYGSDDLYGLADWQASTMLDLHSVAIDPAVPEADGDGSWVNGCMAGAEYHFNRTPGESYEAPPVANVPSDIDGEERPPQVVCIGADEPYDDDHDGIASVIEDRARNNGDGDGDGISDRNQGSVSSTIPRSPFPIPRISVRRVRRAQQSSRSCASSPSNSGNSLRVPNRSGSLTNESNAPGRNPSPRRRRFPAPVPRPRREAATRPPSPVPRPRAEGASPPPSPVTREAATRPPRAQRAPPSA